MAKKTGIANLMGIVSQEAQQVKVIDEPATSVKEENLTPLYIMIPKDLKKMFDLYCANHDTTKKVVITDFLKKLLGNI
ncbi:hypothetical protein [Tannerella forsythia]|uniref:hypothetical protein n=1 Tax=Tannerella forsythia TaxID=28112 RepID=UPI0007649364|nr:hypothetical protein [Tannerella forsythia]